MTTCILLQRTEYMGVLGRSIDVLYRARRVQRAKVASLASLGVAGSGRCGGLTRGAGFRHRRRVSVLASVSPPITLLVLPYRLLLTDSWSPPARRHLIRPDTSPFQPRGTWASPP